MTEIVGHLDELIRRHLCIVPQKVVVSRLGGPLEMIFKTNINIIISLFSHLSHFSSASLTTAKQSDEKS